MVLNPYFRFCRSKPQGPISHALSGIVFPLVAPMCLVDFLGQDPKSPISHAFSGPSFSLVAAMPFNFLGQQCKSPIYIKMLSVAHLFSLLPLSL